MVKLFKKKKKSKKNVAAKAQQQPTKQVADNATSNKTPPQARKKKKAPSSKAAAVLPRSVSKEYNSPLTTIAESHDEASVVETPATETSVLQSVNVVSSTDESMEVVVGSAASSPHVAYDGSEPTLLLQQVHVFENDKQSDDTEVVISDDKVAGSHDDIRKALFQDDDEEEEGTGPVDVDDVDTAVKKAPRPVTPEEPPFDQKAEYAGTEDPAILDLIKRAKEKEEEQQSQQQSGSSQNSITDNKMVTPEQQLTRAIDDDAAPQGMFKSDVRNASITKNLLAALNCNLDTTKDLEPPSCKGMSAFYDTMCTDVRGKRPFFSEEFTRDFMEDSVKDGIPLMYHYEAEPATPGAPPEWKGHSVTMFLRQGNYQGSHIVHPRLEWPTPEQQWTTERPGTVNLMDIHTISDSSEDDVRDDIEGDATEPMDLCFFSITTKDGQVYMFESGSPAERDWIVTGLKNVIVRLAYHLTVGDPAISSELFSGEYEYGSGDLPTLKTPVQAMNEVAHAFLD